jgi:hypothetical protein
MVINTYIIYESLEGISCYIIIGVVGIPVSLRHNGLSVVESGDLHIVVCLWVDGASVMILSLLALPPPHPPRRLPHLPLPISLAPPLPATSSWVTMIG